MNNSFLCTVHNKHTHTHTHTIEGGRIKVYKIKSFEVKIISYQFGMQLKASINMKIWIIIAFAGNNHFLPHDFF